MTRAGRLLAWIYTAAAIGLIGILSLFAVAWGR